jgi:glyoxylase I family protein
MFRFHHVALSVSDTERSKRFYAALGFRAVLTWVSDSYDLIITHLKLGEIILELFCYTEHKKNDDRTLEGDLHEVGVKHFGLKVDSIEEAKRRVVEAGLAGEENIYIKSGRTGITYFFIKDPDGNFVEILEDKRIFELT